MPVPKDAWAKPRSTSDHLTSAEIAFIREGYQHRRLIQSVARDLKCSSRTVTKYYGYFREEGVERIKQNRIAIS